MSAYKNCQESIDSPFVKKTLNTQIRKSPGDSAVYQTTSSNLPVEKFAKIHQKVPAQA